jgi:hypothetical protein
MYLRRSRIILGIVVVIGTLIVANAATKQIPARAAPQSPTYSYSLSPSKATQSTFRVTLTIGNLMGETPPSSTWYGPDGNSVSKGCVSGQQVREFVYSGGVLFQVRDFFYISPCHRELGRYTVKVGSANAGSFSIWTRLYLPLLATPPGPPNRFGKLSPADGISGLQPVSVILDWEASPNADTYAYCYDTSDDDACASWVPTGAITQTEISNLSEKTTYYWQVRATNSLGTSYADGAQSAFWSFATGETITGTWSEQTAAAEWIGRSSHASVVLSDGSIVLMGGYNGEDRLNDVWRSTNQGASWTQMTAAAEWSGRTAATAVALPDDSIVLMGGYEGSYLNDVWRSTNMGANWTQMTAAAEWSKRTGPKSIVLNDGSIVLIGGSYSATRYTDVWRSTDKGATWTEMTPASEWSERFGFSSVALSDDSIVLMGGFSDLNDVWRSIDMGASWSEMTADAPWPGRYNHTSVALSDDSILLFGGSGYRNDVWLSRDQGVTWTQVNIAAPWSGRSGASGVTLPDDSVLLLGGSDGDYLNDVWRFVLE